MENEIERKDTVIAGDTAKEEKTLTQTELEKLISERLKRERKNVAAFSEIREIIGELKKSGAIKSASYADAAKELGTRLQNTRANPSETERAETGNEKEALSAAAPDFEETDSAKTDENEGILNAEEEKESDFNAEFDKMTASELLSLAKSYENGEMLKDISTKSFAAFAKDRKGSIKEIYDAYVGFKREFLPEKYEKTAKSDENEEENGADLYDERELSGFASGVISDFPLNLSKRQMDIARENGMSFREYSELLGSIPQKLPKN